MLEKPTMTFPLLEMLYTKTYGSGYFEVFFFSFGFNKDAKAFIQLNPDALTSL